MRNCTECKRPSRITRSNYRIRGRSGNWVALIGEDEQLCSKCAKTRGTRTLREIHDSRKED